MTRRPLLRSIRARVTLGALLVLTVVLAVGAVGTVAVLDRTLTAGVAAAVDRDLEALADQAEERGGAAVEEVDDDVLVRLGEFVNDEDAARLPAVPEGASVSVDVDGEVWLARAEETDAGLLTVAHSLAPVREAVATARLLLAVAVPLVLVTVAAILWVVVARALAPVERLRRQVEAIDPADTGQRVDPGANDELGALAATMNRMLERIQHAQLTQRRFVSDASHELRSPLATMRQHAEVAVAHPGVTSTGELAGVVLDEGARMQELVEGLLLLARLDEGRRGAVREVDLDDLALAEADRLRGMGVAVDARGVGPARVVGDQALLRRALRNLADNAARHARALVTLRVVAEPGRVLVVVEDDGAGVPPEQRELVFQRFVRLDEGRARDEGGSGLGLAIVREVAQAHGGSATVTPGATGGAAFTLALPT